MKPENTPIVLFGAFDRHNLGDLLFPHVAASLLGIERELVFAGIAERDMGLFGGHRVVSLDRWREAHGRPFDLVHVGGEIFTCDAWEGAVMVLAPDDAQRAIAAYDTDEIGRMVWAKQQLGISRLAPYVAANGRGKSIFCGVGGVELSRRSIVFQEEVLEVLGQADFLGVRDRVTRETLAAAGVESTLVPDPAVMVAELFSERIRRHREAGEAAKVASVFPGGYLAVQFSADFGDDGTLNAIAAQLDKMAGESGLGVAFFRAGAAPWHDDLAVLRAAAFRMKVAKVRVFESLNLWDICALIAGSQGYCGSSLHGRIVATAFALPRLNFLHPSQEPAFAKQEAYGRTWEMEGMPGAVAVNEIADALSRSLAADRDGLRRTADRLCMAYREAFSLWSACLKEA